MNLPNVQDPGRQLFAIISGKPDHIRALALEESWQRRQQGAIQLGQLHGGGVLSFFCVFVMCVAC